MATFDRTTPVQIVNTAYTTNGNTSEKIRRLSNGWFISSAKNTSDGRIHIYKSEDEGATWSQLCTKATGDTSYDFVLLSEGVNVYIFDNRNTNKTVNVSIFDATTVTNTDVPTTTVIDSGQTSIGQLFSAAMNSTGTKLTVAWVSKNSTYANSFNIRVRQGDIAGGVVTWGSTHQMTIQNNGTRNYTHPTVVYNALDNPIVVYRYISSGNYTIEGHVWNGSSWVYITGAIYGSVSDQQAYFSMDMLSDGTIIMAWQGIHPTNGNWSLYFCQSTDNGDSWTAPELVTSETTNQTYPCITRNELDEIFIVFDFVNVSNSDPAYVKGSIGSWGSINIIEDLSGGGVRHPNAIKNFRGYINPLVMYMTGASEIKFYGLWKIGLEYRLTLSSNITLLETQEIHALDSITPYVNDLELPIRQATNEYYEYKVGEGLTGNRAKVKIQASDVKLDSYVYALD